MARTEWAVSVALLALAYTDAPIHYIPYLEVGSSPSMVFAFENDADHRWVSLGDTMFMQVIHNIAPTPDGFMFVGGTGLFSFYVVSEGHCPIEAQDYMGLRTAGTGRRVLSFGDGVLVGGGTAVGRQQALSWIRRR